MKNPVLVIGFLALVVVVLVLVLSYAAKTAKGRTEAIRKLTWKLGSGWRFVETNPPVVSWSLYDGPDDGHEPQRYNLLVKDTPSGGIQFFDSSWETRISDDSDGRRTESQALSASFVDMGIVGDKGTALMAVLNQHGVRELRPQVVLGVPVTVCSENY
jgi:hypothetical protein